MKEFYKTILKQRTLFLYLRSNSNNLVCYDNKN
jgi:hypothetical protein